MVGWRSMCRGALLSAVLIVLAAGGALASASAEGLPERVAFLSADGKTELVGYVFTPLKTAAPRVPAVVMMHGRAGAYSSRAGGVYDASTLSRRHRMWGRLWADAGYVAILVDGFGPRGYPQGFPRFSYDERPPEVSEATARPLDAYGALVWLRTRDDVAPERIGLQGWSNGGSATLWAMAVDAPGIRAPTPETGFRAALALYPACGHKGGFAASYRPYAPLRVFHGTADEEVSPRRCGALVERARAQGGDIRIRFYDGATHGFDDPSRKRRRIPANAAAADDAIAQAQRFFAEELERK